jgi:hypothetical protein
VTSELMIMKRRIFSLLLLCLLLLAACRQEVPRVAELATATLMPIVTQTERATASPVPSRTPLPTFTFTPTETAIPPTATLSPTPTLTPTLVGIVQSLQAVNVREGPGTNFGSFTALVPGTGVQIIGRDAEGDWLNVRLEDGREGWVSARLLTIPATETPFPTMTPSPDLTALFLGTPLPTAFLGGGTVTPTPPSSVVTATPFGFEASPAPTDANALPTGSSPLSFIPTAPSEALLLTSTALVRNAATTTATRTPTLLPTAEREITLPPTLAANVTANATTSANSGTPTATLDVNVNQGLTDEQVKALTGVDVFAFCDNVRAYGIGAPKNLTAGSTIDIYWAWFAADEQQVQQHVGAAVHDLRLNGQPLPNVDQYRTRIRREGDGYAVYWYVPYGPLAAGNYEVTYSLTWTRQITDGNRFYGPETSIPFEQESCKFTVK